MFTDNAAGIPDQVSSITTTVEGTFIKVDWAAPNSNFRTISAYLITIKDKGSGVFVEDKNLCDGSDTEVLSNSACFIPMI